MFVILIVLQVLYFRQAYTIDGLKISPGIPVPHAEELDRILSARIFENSAEQDSDLFGYLFGDIQNLTDSEAYEFLDISVLDPEAVKRIVTIARRKNEMIENLQNQTLEEQEIARNGWYHNQVYIVKSMTFMQQSIYATRRRLECTRPFRKKYQNDISYNIAILYGTLMEMRTKIDIMYSTLSRMYFSNYFIWYLFLYQRILAANVDISFIVERMFDFQAQWHKKIGTKEEGEYYYNSQAQVGDQFVPDLPPKNEPPAVSVPDNKNNGPGGAAYPNPDQPIPEVPGHDQGIPGPEHGNPGFRPERGPSDYGPAPIGRVGRSNLGPGGLVPGPS